MQESTRLELQKHKNAIKNASTSDAQVRYDAATFLTQVKSNSVKYNPDEYAEVITEFGMDTSTANKWMAAVSVINADEFASYLGITGADFDTVFGWSHMLELSKIKAPKNRHKAVEAWKKGDAKLQSIRGFTKYVQEMVNPSTDDAGSKEITPVMAIKKFLSAATKMSEVLEEISSTDFSEIPDNQEERLTNLSEHVIYIAAKIAEISQALGITVEFEVSDVDSDEEDEEEEDVIEEEPVVAQPVSSAKKRGGAASKKAEPTKKVAESKPESKLALKRVPVKAVKENKPAAAATLDGATAAAATGPAKDRRRGKSAKIAK